ncbi:hypothetical protein PCYB_004440 [Plasmodium cynomolgi strain B]|uniref:Uncharacterized protein n=1 Tax=Plasmodium cynomolgi (strain B) TaxID=1120755 RepID=K6V2Z9_PLACD|nr:hypothetical protein PCYB_004440 [Plasmodium cynomolgi strain B]GAB69695.1 hypothetical protein PCYB_004440 [Plasmodium cynomolgi strain B]
MKKLYELYDYYQSFSDERKYSGDIENCNTLSQVINDYNTIINDNQYKNSIYLFKELKIFKCLIEKNDLFTSGKCDLNSLKFTTPEGHSLECEKSYKYNEKISAAITISLIGGMTGIIILYKYITIYNFKIFINISILLLVLG